MNDRIRPFVDVHSDLLMDVIEKRAYGNKHVIEDEWVPGMRTA